MDYPFGFKKICDVPLSLVEEILAAAKASTYTKHPHFYKTQPVTTVIGPPDFSTPLGIATKKLLDVLPLPREAVTMWEVNKLGAWDNIAEHSDIAAQDGAQGNLVVKSHKIHIPLQTSSRVGYGHRRSRALPVDRRPMSVGAAYAYNNYIWHDVVNDSNEDRYQMTMRFWDPDWVIRAALMTQLGYSGTQSYEHADDY